MIGRDPERVVRHRFPWHRLLVAGLVGALLAAGWGATRPGKSAQPAVAKQPPGPPRRLVERDAWLTGDEEYLELMRRFRFESAPQPPQPAVETYALQEGDTIWLLARYLNLDVDSLLALNPEIDVMNLVPGQELNIVRGFQGVVYRSRTGDGLEAVAARFGVDRQDLLRTNGLTDDALIEAGQLLFVPGVLSQSHLASRGNGARRVAAAPARPQPEPMEPGGVEPPPSVDVDWLWPITDGALFSEFGPRDEEFHTGLDIAAPTGTPVHAARSGTVRFAGWDGGYGYNVILDHGDGVTSRYAHASALLVGHGDQVAQGESIALVGSTGHSTGPHLHFEVIIDGSPVNPRRYLP